MPIKVTDPLKIVTDTLLLKQLVRQGIDKDYVEFSQDYAPSNLGKEHSPYAKFYRDLKSNKRFMVVSGLPMVKPDGAKIEVGWVKRGGRYISKPNLFSASVKGKQVVLTCLYNQPNGVKAGDAVTYQPRLYLDNVEQLPVSNNPTLLAVDPTNKNYLENTLEWDYGVCKRRLRIIEGYIVDKWWFFSNPTADVRIKHNLVGNLKLRLGSADDSALRVLRVMVVGDEERIPASEFNKATYPVGINASLEAGTEGGGDSDNPYQLQGGLGETWAWVHDGPGNGGHYDQTYVSFAFIADDTDDAGKRWYYTRRGLEVYVTGSLPDTCTITAATLSYYGYVKADTLSCSPSVNIYSSNPANESDIVDGDYDSCGTTPFSTAITYANWLTNADSPYWNDFVFVQAGLDAISKTAGTKLSKREVTYDVADVEPTWGSLQEAYIAGYSYRQGVGYKPKLVVTYTTGWAGGNVNGVAIAGTAPVIGVAAAGILRVNGVA